MSTYYQDERVTLYHGDCLDVLRTLPDESVHAVVTDPPAGISFMGKDWDGHKGGREQWSAWLADVMREAYRVTKPGGHALVWALPRTSHWTACGLEDAGWEIRDKIVHLFGTGFPKSLDVSKAIDKAAGVEREVVGTGTAGAGFNKVKGFGAGTTTKGGEATSEWDLTAPATPDAERWQGWGTALKPAAEDWWLARKPMGQTVAANVLQHGTGALNIDGCRVGDGGGLQRPPRGGKGSVGGWAGYTAPDGQEVTGTPDGKGRWPANVVLDDSQAAELDEQSGESVSTVGVPGKIGGYYLGGCSTVDDLRALAERGEDTPDGRNTAAATLARYERSERRERGHNDSGGASRFFYVAKAPTTERPRVDGVAHPTVKPLTLMSWLVRLVTPPGGTVLEPFAGSGTTVEACIVEGFHCIAIEREADYLPLIMQRVNRRRDPVAYIEAAGDDLGLFGIGDA